jgi:hypothetical protein
LQKTGLVVAKVVAATITCVTQTAAEPLSRRTAAKRSALVCSRAFFEAANLPRSNFGNYSEGSLLNPQNLTPGIQAMWLFDVILNQQLAGSRLVQGRQNKPSGKCFF